MMAFLLGILEVERIVVNTNGEEASEGASHVVACNRCFTQVGD